MKKWILSFLGLMLLLIICGLAYLKFLLPDVGDPEPLRITSTPELVARGAYLANHVTVCIDCHSKRDWTKFSGPIVDGTEGMGGDAFNQELGFPGVFYAKNITPAALNNWTDGELLRAIGSGVSKDGKAFFPVMPYHNYGRMDKEDLIAIIAYLRTLKPIANEVPASQADFPMSLLINTMPQKPAYTKRPEKAVNALYGGYVFNAAGCGECHTQVDKGKPIEGMELAGGRDFKFPDGKVIYSANITPDKETGIGGWTEEVFMGRFKSYADKQLLTDYKSPSDRQTVMPWNMYAGMDSVDLKALYAYLGTVKPIRNKVTVNP